MVQILMVLFFSLVVHAEEKSTDPRPDMHVLVQEIVSMEKFLFSEASFTSAQNEPLVKDSIQKLSKHVKKMEGTDFSQNPALKVNLALLSRQLGDAEKSFQDGHKAFSRFLLQSALQLCINCHTREKVAVDFALPSDTVPQTATAIERAEFFFATRQFEKGKKEYVTIVEGFPGNKDLAIDVRKSLLALAVYFTRVKEDPAGGAEFFSKIGKRKDLPPYILKEVKAWADDFASWSKEKKVAPKSEVEYLTAAKKLLKKDDFSYIGDADRRFHIRRLRASVLFQKVLEAPGEKSPMKGEALFYLGQIYQRIAHQLFFRFGELYLKTCITEYKKTHEAQECYNALEQAVTDGYTGSAGTSIPQEEEVELVQLKRLAF